MPDDTLTSATAAFDKPVYAPGDTIRLTVTVSPDDPAPQEITVSGKATLTDGTTATFTGTLTVDPAAPTLVSATLDPDVSRVWSTAVIAGNTAVFTAVA